MTQLDAVIKALEILGGEAHYKKITEVAARYAFFGTHTPEQSVKSIMYFRCSESKAYKGEEDLFYMKGGPTARNGIFGLKRVKYRTFKKVG